MGLDFGFYKQNEEEVLAFRSHGNLFDMLCEEPYVRIAPYTDFYVTRPMVTAVLKKIEKEIQVNGLAPHPLPSVDTTQFEEMVEAIPHAFFWADPEDRIAALHHYRVLLTKLLAEVRRDGCLICGWSA